MREVTEATRISRWPRTCLRLPHKITLVLRAKKRAQESQITWKHAETDASKRKLTQVNANWRYLPEVDFLCFWFRKIVSVFGLYHLVSDTCFRLRKIASVLEQYRSASDTSDKKNSRLSSAFGHLRPFLDGIDWFRTSVFRRFGPISKTGSVFVTISADFRHF